MCCEHETSRQSPADVLGSSVYSIVDQCRYSAGHFSCNEAATRCNTAVARREEWAALSIVLDSHSPSQTRSFLIRAVPEE